MENISENIFLEPLDEGIESDFKPITNDDQIRLLQVLCPVCVFEFKLVDINGINKTVLEQTKDDFVNLTQSFTVREVETIFGRKFKIDRFGHISSVININELGMIPISSDKKLIRSDHSDVLEIVEQAFETNISLWNTLNGLKRHIQRKHLYLLNPFTSKQALRMPLEKAIREASIKLIKLYKEESVTLNAPPNRSVIKLVHLCYKTLKVSLLTYENLISSHI